MSFNWNGGHDMSLEARTSGGEQLELTPGGLVKGEAEDTEQKRARVLHAVAAGRLDTMQEKVAWILNHYPETRDSDIALQVSYWKQFEDDLFDGHSISIKDYYKLTRLTSILRERARIQNVYKLFLASDDIRKRRGTIEENEYEKSIGQHAAYHHYAVYIDESGKTGDNLIVGSVWFLDGAESLKVMGKLMDWKNANSFQDEFHFKAITEAKLQSYLEVADFIAENSSVMSFKAISVARKGAGNVNDALARLTFHLLTRGIDKENQSGRAPLPRWIQVWKDAEEEGYDKLFLADLQTKMKEASNTLFEGKLQVDDFYPENSEGNVLIQIADLFTSSLNRVLNATGERKHPKDTFADYLLTRLGLPQGPSQREQHGDMTVHIAL